ncbi:MAG: tripartite tricarboxylate transporter permease, partial [Verrucomicrobiota bacterium]
MAELFHYSVLLPWVIGMIFGIFVGATPGLTATMAVALIVPVSFHLEPNAGLALIIGVSFTAIFAGDIPATFLRIPGTPASAAATLDGYPLARKGKGPFALTLDLLCSCAGGLVGVVLLMLLAPQLARVALKFSNFEYFWLGLLGLSISALVSQKSLWRGLLAAVLGLLLATVGEDIVSGKQRYVFGSMELMSGISFIPAMIGLFGLSEVLRSCFGRSEAEGAAMEVQGGTAPLVEGTFALWKHKFLCLKSAVVGTLIGALPGAGADIAAWGAYGLARKTSKQPETFGQGAEEGVVAPTSANNAAVAGAWIPALIFGVPGDAVTAIVLGALTMYGIKPGPLIFEQSGGQVQSILWIAFFTQFLLLVCGLVGIRVFSRLLRLRKGLVMAGVLVFSIVGSYALNNSFFDVGV